MIKFIILTVLIFVVFFSYSMVTRKSHLKNKKHSDDLPSKDDVIDKKSGRLFFFISKVLVAIKIIVAFFILMVFAIFAGYMIQEENYGVLAGIMVAICGFYCFIRWTFSDPKDGL